MWWDVEEENVNAEWDPPVRWARNIPAESQVGRVDEGNRGGVRGGRRENGGGDDGGDDGGEDGEEDGGWGSGSVAEKLARFSMDSQGVTGSVERTGPATSDPIGAPLGERALDSQPIRSLLSVVLEK